MEVTAAGHGRAWSAGRLIDTSLGRRLRYSAHRVTRDGDWHVLTVGLHDPETGDLLYPSAGRARPAWTPDTAELSLTLPTAPSAVLLRITSRDADAP
ncbi:hypothetical protein GCM10023084_76940 [Streptomyces lacrimifluminis]|uniref:Uncharacterized protein n=1 Tax=Streptomyces lacrimifluminis TaxID=1500077 RepID=A0A917P919_9ACTN|nr:hypothetical protein [Streptomyces lacrimifluminis]GGJ67268.1 hypothetical protein GCM10012282_75360 [Streptomyces lacrimifluminis]